MLERIMSFQKKSIKYFKIKFYYKFFKKVKPKCLVHLAGLSRPLKYIEDIEKSINLNIIGTSNITIACSRLNIKLIFFSTSYVYPGTRGNYKESDPLLPINNYAWSKLGADQQLKCIKTLLFFACMTEKPFIHKFAFSNVKSNFIFHEDFAKLFLKVINRKGVLNIGGPPMTVYNFVKKYNKKVKKKYLKKEKKINLPINTSMNLNRLKKFIK